MRNIYKHIIGIIFVWIGIHILFSLTGGDIIVAQTTQTATALSESIQSKIFWYNSLLHMIYLIIWPALALGGLALDNGMIYGSFIGMDAPLFLIRNIIKNIANFILGFMVLFEILKNFFTTGEQGKKAFDVIKKSLIAGVLIQASWFLMGALIDVSTIATYSIGGMPISILNNSVCEENLGKMKFLPIGTNIDFTASNQNTNIDNSFQYYYYINTGTTKDYYSPCEIYDGRWIVGQKYRPGAGNIPYTKNYCILPNNMFAYFGQSDTVQLAVNTTTVVAAVPGLSNILHNDVGDDHIKYNSNLKNIIDRGTGALRDPVIRSGWLAADIIFDITKAPFTSGDQPGIYTTSATGLAINPFDSAIEIQDIIKKTKGLAGVLISLYKSILHFTSFDTGSSSTDTMILMIEAAIKVAFGGVLLIPLIIMSVALVIRIGYIWLFIAISPILALQIAFSGDSSIKGIWGSIPLIKDGIGSVLRMIFAPVIIVFAVSFSLIFMTALISSINNTSDNNTGCIGTQKDFYGALGGSIEYTGNTTTYQIGNIAEIQQNVFGLDMSVKNRDVFGWLLINLFGAAIVWLLLFTVIETVFKGTPVGNRKLKQTAENMIGSIPIIPVPDGAGGVTGIGAGTASRLAEAKIDQISRRIDPRTISQDILNKKQPGDKQNNGGSSRIDSIKNDENARNAVVTAAATQGLGNSAMVNVAGLNDEQKKADVTELSKQILVDDIFYTEFYKKIEDDTSKIEQAADWINNNTATLTQEQFRTLLNRKDKLSYYLAPTADNQVVTLSGGNYTVVFDISTKAYTLQQANGASNNYTMNNSETPPAYTQVNSGTGGGTTTTTTSP